VLEAEYYAPVDSSVLSGGESHLRKALVIHRSSRRSVSAFDGIATALPAGDGLAMTVKAALDCSDKMQSLPPLQTRLRRQK
jgi:hypothetical protein